MGIRFEKEFISKLKQQDHNAFNRFYLENVDMLFRYIQSNYFLSAEDAQDIISDFYVKFRESIKNFREDESFSGYFWIIFKNLVKDHFKKNSDTQFTELGWEDDDNISFEDNLADEEDISLRIFKKQWKNSMMVAEIFYIGNLLKKKVMKKFNSFFLSQTTTLDKGSQGQSSFLNKF